MGRFEGGVMLPPPPPSEGLCGAPGGPESLLAMAEVTRAHHRITCPECRACLPTMPPIYVRRETDE